VPASGGPGCLPISSLLRSSSTDDSGACRTTGIFLKILEVLTAYGCMHLIQKKFFIRIGAGSVYLISTTEDTMETLVMVLSFGTIGFVAVFGYLSARATENLKNDPTHKRSTLCANSEHWRMSRN
jgi:hypothetical protein